ncbi:MAG: hypothetical protein QXT64_07785 [Desulfurococcaceae archaeon]
MSNSYYNLLRQIERVVTYVESIYVEVLLMEQLLCEVAKKLGIDSTVVSEVCQQTRRLES